jgi:hypothetical protein
MCGIDQGKSKATVLNALYDVKPLENNAPFELQDDGTQIWHPDWDGHISMDVNTAFISAIIDRVWENERVSSGEYLV